MSRTRLRPLVKWTMQGYQTRPSCKGSAGITRPLNTPCHTGASEARIEKPCSNKELLRGRRQLTRTRRLKVAVTPKWRSMNQESFQGLIRSLGRGKAYQHGQAVQKKGTLGVRRQDKQEASGQLRKSLAGRLKPKPRICGLRKKLAQGNGKELAVPRLEMKGWSNSVTWRPG